ncbi:2-oxoacid dehydrogenases acyltransferase-domain-containing protein [Fimicolochytrium jonesii]|uniref:2-oxoacid dehydrogenases acyltransferase-domain-containing protein n=1 Tax=Fimicolochytrium jonesii TaxID=1396493 RepID=UPI0022FEF667|nr:2-oxoacid dehydrogenases acyltransferase-domain-containing protein [Fimicolochytrium jonesii]KAI8820369.1 2-oxoacid dehydrogenases acyltransferase-domain-containing protein [Fimicolochytrium jonesii]
MPAAASNVSRAAALRLARVSAVNQTRALHSCAFRVASLSSRAAVPRMALHLASPAAPRIALGRRAFHAAVASRKDIPFLLADIGEGITECELIQWFVKEGDKVEQFSPICEVQSDKAAVEISSRYDGVVKKLYYKTGDVAKVGAPLVDITTDEADTDAVPGTAELNAPEAVLPATQVAQEAAAGGRARTDRDMEESWLLTTPAVRRIAREHSIDLVKVTGTGPSGRVLKGDVLAFISGTSKPRAAETAAPPSAATAPSSAPAKPAAPRVIIPAGEDKVVPLGPIQKAMFKSMTKSLEIPHFGFSEEIILNAASKHREDINHYLKNNNNEEYPFKKISYMPIFMKALSMALVEFPILNARLINADQVSTAQLQYRAAHNIGIAMDTPQGLIVPNVKNVESKSVLDIASDLERLKESGRKGAISPSDLKDGTITLSNVGNIGGTLLHPVLVSSELCIGAIGRTQRLPRFETVVDPVTGRETERVVAKEVLNVSFNADHRVIDGATVARFVQLWKTYLEQPAVMTASMR